MAQADRSLPGAKGEIQVIKRLDMRVEGLVLGDATTGIVLEGLRRHQLVHFACHGDLEIGKPFDASFKLYGDEKLKLLDIVHSRLPTAEFAFLSACHTAELTEESIADEGLHLTAALQYCGFRSVIGTTWAMADTDGRDLARHVYRSMLSGNDEEPCYLRSAEALRDAVRRLRRMRGVTLERWMNFVHYGALSVRIQLVPGAAMIPTLLQDHYQHPRAPNCCLLGDSVASYSTHDGWLEQILSRSTANPFLEGHATTLPTTSSNLHLH